MCYSNKCFQGGPYRSHLDLLFFPGPRCVPLRSESLRLLDNAGVFDLLRLAINLGMVRIVFDPVGVRVLLLVHFPEIFNLYKLFKEISFLGPVLHR